MSLRNVNDAEGMQTLAVHAGKPAPPIEDAIAMPIFQSSTYLLGSPEEFDDIRYIRLNNTPNHHSVASKLAALEGTESAVVTPSGTAAISMALLAHLRAGEHVIAARQLYGGTRKILDGLMERYGVETSYVSFEKPETWEQALRPSTRVLYVESITNPLLDIPPLDMLVQFARRHQLVSIIDNTLPSPVNFRPAAMGFDVVVHSASKSLNGHTDIVAGVVAASGHRVANVRKMLNLVGVCLDPHACFLLERGLKTLPLRIRAQNDNAAALARSLQKANGVKAIRYPGLPSDPSHARARAWFNGYGGMVSFLPEGDTQKAEELLSELGYAQVAPSLGGVETLVCRPATTSHAGLPERLRREMGIPDEMIRVSVGIENADDLIGDFLRALGNSRPKGHTAEQRDRYPNEQRS